MRLNLLPHNMKDALQVKMIMLHVYITPVLMKYNCMYKGYNSYIKLFITITVQRPVVLCTSITSKNICVPLSQEYLQLEKLCKNSNLWMQI